MESQAPQVPEPASSSLPVLTPRERRALGVLVEKAKTTPDAYPMSLNALITGCNQKSNRDPILSLSQEDVEETLAALQQKGLAIKITGGRVVRWRHNLYDTWRLGKAELAVMGELLLRGPQTEGELRSRASRMEPIDELDALRAILKPLSERGFVIYLTPEGRRGTVLTHGFHAAEEMEGLKDSGGTDPSGAEETSRDDSAPNRRRGLDNSADLRVEVDALRTSFQEMQERIARLEQWAQREGDTPNGRPDQGGAVVSGADEKGRDSMRPSPP